MATIFFGENETPQEFLTDSAATALSFQDFTESSGSSVYSLESGLYYLDSNIFNIGANDLRLDDGTGVLRRSAKQNIFMKDDDNIIGLNVPSVEPSSLDGNDVAVLEDESPVGGITLTTKVVTAGGATADIDIIVSHKIQIINVHVINIENGNAGDTLTVKNGSNNITNAIDLNEETNFLRNTSEIIAAQQTIEAAGTLRITETDGGGNDSPAVTVVITYVRVA